MLASPPEDISSCGLLDAVVTVRAHIGHSSEKPTAPRIPKSPIVAISLTI